MVLTFSQISRTIPAQAGEAGGDFKFKVKDSSSVSDPYSFDSDPDPDPAF
jgi:hypothetical protein